MIVSVHQPQYIPWLGYFHKILKSGAFVFLDRVQYKAAEFQNRNKIRTQDGWMWLSVPVLSQDNKRQIISDVKIDNSSPWQKDHMESLKTWYGRSGFFKEHLGFFKDLYSKQWLGLSQLNTEIISYVMKYLELKTPFFFESDLDIKSAKTDRIIDICRKLKADTYFSGTGGRDYLEEDKFIKTGIKLEYQDFKHPVYHQQFMKDANDFLPFMSILDLLFNEGPGARDILGNS